MFHQRSTKGEMFKVLRKKFGPNWLLSDHKLDLEMTISHLVFWMSCLVDVCFLVVKTFKILTAERVPSEWSPFRYIADIFSKDIFIVSFDILPIYWQYTAMAVYRQYIGKISELAMNISFENISAIYRDWLHSLGTRSAVKILKVFTTHENPILLLAFGNNVLKKKLIFFLHSTHYGSHHVYWHMHVLFKCEPL